MAFMISPTTLQAYKPFERVIVKAIRPAKGTVTRAAIVDYPADWKPESLDDLSVVYLGKHDRRGSEHVVQVTTASVEAWEIDGNTISRLRDYNEGVEYNDGLLVGKHAWYILTSGIVGRAVSPHLRPLDDGMACDMCNNFAPMASANMSGGKFRCYSCRQDPWRASF